MGSLEDVDPEGFAELLAVNLVAPVILMGMVVRAAPAEVPVRIVNVSTGAAVQAFPGIGEYGSSKAALRLASGRRGRFLFVNRDLAGTAGDDD